MVALFDYVIRSDQQALWYGEAQALGRFTVDYQLKPSGLYHCKFRPVEIHQRIGCRS